MSIKYLAGVLLLATTFLCHAGVVINTTRVIYNEAEGEAVVQLRNTGSAPLLVQAWLDAGDASARVETLTLPFALTPSVARIDPGRAQALRILRIRNELPVDRESLLWFNVLEVPPVPTRKLEQGDNLLQFSFHSRIKFFYRPKGLPSTPADALDLLDFTINRGADPGPTVIVRNGSPYYVTFRSISLRQDVESPSLAEIGDTRSRMVAPGGELTLPMKWTSDHVAIPAFPQLFFTTINDQGGESRVRKGVIRDEAKE